MADYLGLTIETVSRTMTKLAARGVIVSSGRHAITIRNLEQLACLAADEEELDSEDIRPAGGKRPSVHNLSKGH